MTNPHPPAISVCIVAHNEARNIERAIGSVSGWASEILVMDRESTDGTATIAARLGVVVFDAPHDRLPDAAKNVLFEKASGDWIFSLDADEVVTPALRSEIDGLLASGATADGYKIPRRNHYFGVPLMNGGHYPDRQLRLFRRGRGRYPTGAVHERIAVDGEVAALREPFDHHPYPTFAVWLQKLDFYTETAAAAFSERAVPITPATIRHYMVTRPLRRWLERLFLKRGIRDGVPGVFAATADLITAVASFARYWQGRNEKARGGVSGTE